MAVSSRDREDEIFSDSATDADGEASDHVVLMYDEDTPLLSTDLPADIVPDKAFQRLVLIMGALALIIVTISQIIVVPALAEILEDVICRRQYPDHQLNIFKTNDPRCQDKLVQGKQTMVRAWGTVTEMLVPMLVQIPYGIIADKYGRQPVLFFALLGCLLQQSWNIVVLMYPDTFSPWSILYGSLAYLIGGGGPMATSITFTMLSDTTPAAQRSTTFYYISAVQRIVIVAATPLAAALLKIDPWITLWIGYGSFVVGTLTALLVPETLKLRQKADDLKKGTNRLSQASFGPVGISTKSVLAQALSSARDDVSHLWRFLIQSEGVRLLILAAGFYFPIRIAFSSDLLQYLHNRFNWDYSTVTYVTTVEHLTSVLVLTIILPLVGKILCHYGYSPLRKDLMLGRISLAFLITGCLLLALAPKAWLCILSLVIFSASNGLGSVIRAILSAIVEPHTIGALNSVLSATECGITIISAPSLGWVLNKGRDLGGIWRGLEFMVVTGLAAVCAALISWFKLPTAFE